MWGKLSSWIFLVGIVVAIIVGLAIGADAIDPLYSGADTPAYAAAFLGAIGFIAGILAVMGMGTITEKERPTFMLATLIIIALSGVGYEGIKWFGDYLAGIVSALGIFIAPLAGLIAIKAIWDVGKD
ncbi:MAG: hypothetical protein KGY55_05005 [Candidatus Thermoplasmatota archaeon]|nr:hypothetical protein [Candidatus Thermoplasmatota archaeon]